jgi:hypothetical protein
VGTIQGGNVAEMPEWFEFEFVVKGTYRVKADELNFIYGTTDLDEVAAHDKEQLESDPGVLDYMVSQDVTYEVRPVRE